MDFYVAVVHFSYLARREISPLAERTPAFSFKTHAFPRHFAHLPLIFTGWTRSPQFGLDFRPEVAFDTLFFRNEATV